MAMRSGMGTGAEYIKDQAVAYMNVQDAFLGFDLIPMLESPVISGRVKRHGFEFAMSDADSSADVYAGARRPAYGEYNPITFSEAYASFTIKDYGIAVPVDPLVKAESEEHGGDYDEDAGIAAMATTLIAWERIVGTLLTTLATYDSNHRTTLSGTDQYSDPNNSAPIKDFHTRLRMQAKVGNPSRLIDVVTNGTVWDYLSVHPGLLTEWRYTQAGFISRANMIEGFELNDFRVAEGAYNSAGRGAAVSPDEIWGNHVIFMRVDRSTGRHNGSFVRRAGYVKRGQQGELLERGVGPDGLPLLLVGKPDDESNPQKGGQYSVVSKFQSDIFVNAPYGADFIKDAA